ncbi:MAG: hypothetical protein DMD63_04290 [Gemmatimonadetes bacterium]|nr:MAG: hypothetical protein DMD63_04290 [Gemmatimonadota bacterium]
MLCEVVGRFLRVVDKRQCNQTHAAIKGLLQNRLVGGALVHLSMMAISRSRRKAHIFYSP